MTTQTKNNIKLWFKNNFITVLLVIAGFTLTQIQADSNIKAEVEKNKALYEKDIDYIKESIREIKIEQGESIKEIKVDIKDIKQDLKEKKDK